MDARRIFVYGVTGSGKSCLAERLSEKTRIPWHSVDDLTWLPNWQMVPDDEQRAKIRAVCEGEKWILDTAYAKWKDIPLARVQLIVALDYPRWVSLGRLLKRTIARAVDGRPVCNGNRESWRLVFSRESIIGWHFKSFARKRARIREWVDQGLPVIRHASPKDTERWLESIGPVQTGT